MSVPTSDMRCDPLRTIVSQRLAEAGTKNTT